VRVLVTGSRQILDQALVYEQLDRVYVEWHNTFAYEAGDVFTVVHGNAPGADHLASQWVTDRRSNGMIVEEPHPADWRRGHYAGHQRNFEMVKLGADIVLAFFQPGAGNMGTRNCVENAKRWLEHRGTKIEEFWADA
jgi:hypothetical protein